MAQDYPDDYDGILAGAPAIHWDRFQAGRSGLRSSMYRDNGGPIGGGVAATLIAKETLATSKAVAACDALDGVIDGVLTDPRACAYSAAKDSNDHRGALHRERHHLPHADRSVGDRQDVAGAGELRQRAIPAELSGA